MKQATVKLPSGEYCVIRVPKDAINFGVHYILQRFTYWYGPAKIFHEDETPPGNWKLLGTDPTSLTEEEAGEIVESWDSPTGGDDYQDYYKNYHIETEENFMHLFHFTDPLPSLDSLAQSLGVSKPYVILKNVEK